MKKTIGIIGTGFVGLCTAIAYAEKGFSVIAMDNDHNKIDGLRKGIAPFYEPGIEKVFNSNITFTSEVSDLKDCSIIFLALPTPGRKNGEANLDFIQAAAESLKKVFHNQEIILIVKSTSPSKVVKLIKKIMPQSIVVLMPEFLREGLAVRESLYPNYICLGTSNQIKKRHLTVLNELTDSFKTESGDKTFVLFTDYKTASIIKYLHNGFAAIRIMTANLFALFCEFYGAKFSDVRQILRRMPSNNGLDFYPGTSPGGSCLPKDLAAIASVVKPANNWFLNFFIKFSQFNKKTTLMILELFLKKANLKPGTKIGVLGLSFKQDTEDTRDSQSLVVIKYLLKKGYVVHSYDPKVKNTESIFKRAHAQKKYFQERTVDTLLDKCDVSILMVKWPEIINTDYHEYLLKGDTILFDPKAELNLYHSYPNYYNFGDGLLADQHEL